MLAIGIAAVGGLLVIWYLAFARYNRRRAARILSRMQSGWRGKITTARWADASRLYVGLQVPSSMFRRTRITLKLIPRPVPVNWLLSHWHKQQETLTFEADLDHPPSFNLEVHNHRWSGQSAKHADDSQNWTVTRPGPVVLTTCEEWRSDHNPMLNTLLAARERNFLIVRFRPDSPHFSATLPLECLPDQEAAAQVLGALRELAAGARTPHQ
jgi:hypothetical protein